MALHCIVPVLPLPAYHPASLSIFCGLAAIRSEFPHNFPSQSSPGWCLIVPDKNEGKGNADLSGLVFPDRQLNPTTQNPKSRLGKQALLMVIFRDLISLCEAVNGAVASLKWMCDWIDFTWLTPSGIQSLLRPKHNVRFQNNGAYKTTETDSRETDSISCHKTDPEVNCM